MCAVCSAPVMTSRWLKTIFLLLTVLPLHVVDVESPNDRPPSCNSSGWKYCYSNGERISIVFNTSQDAARMRLYSGIWGSPVDYLRNYSSAAIPIHLDGNFTVELLSNFPLKARVNATFTPHLDGRNITCSVSNANGLQPLVDVTATVQLKLCQSPMASSAHTPVSSSIGPSSTMTPTSFTDATAGSAHTPVSSSIGRSSTMTPSISSQSDFWTNNKHWIIPVAFIIVILIAVPIFIFVRKYPIPMVIGIITPATRSNEYIL